MNLAATVSRMRYVHDIIFQKLTNICWDGCLGNMFALDLLLCTVYFYLVLLGFFCEVSWHFCTALISAFVTPVCEMCYINTFFLLSHLWRTWGKTEAICFYCCPVWGAPWFQRDNILSKITKLCGQWRHVMDSKCLITLWLSACTL